MVNMQKVAVIGCGFVGATSAFSLIQSGLFSEMVLIDANHEKAVGEAMDLSHGSAYSTPVKIYAGSYDDIVDAVISTFSVIDDEIDADKIEEMLDNAMYIKGYQDFYCSNGIKYMVDCSESFVDISMSPEK